MIVSNILKKWYAVEQRELPWRKTTNPYNIWLSEIILQQTQIKQGLPYYLKFIKAFPIIQDLANASELEILNLWQGLGYYSRARNLHYTAQYICSSLNGNFPSTYNDIIKLKGIGDYTASAIASICFGEICAVVDGNVYRFLSRLFGVETPINSSTGQKYFKQKAQELICKKDPAAFNQAIMEFGSRHCKPKNPYCNSCPFAKKCVAFNTNTVLNFPVKLKKASVKKRYFNYLVFVTPNKHTVIEKRIAKDIWYNLYQFPLVETKKTIIKKAIENYVKQVSIVNNSNCVIKKHNQKPIIHKLSHQHLYTTFWVVETSKNISNSISFSVLKNYPMPVLINKFLNSFITA